MIQYSKGEKMDDKNFLIDVCQKLNLHKGNFVAYAGNGQSELLLPALLGSVGGIVVNENNQKSKTNLKSNPQMRNVRFVESMRDLDESAFDRIVCFYWEGLFYPTPEEALNKLIESGDNKSLILVSGSVRYMAKPSLNSLY